MNFRVVTSRGWGWLATSILCWVVGAIFGWIELIGIASAGLVSFAAATVYAIFKHSHQVIFQIPHHRVVVGQPAELVVQVINPTSHSLPGLDVFVRVGEEELFTRVGRLSKQETQEIVLPVPTDQRGQREVGPIRIVRADPLGLISREVTTGNSELMYIHPQTVNLLSMSSGFVRDLEGVATTDLTDSDLSFHALREYLPGDDRRNIHWKSSAKTGQFMVRQFEQTRRSHLMVMLDTHADDYASDEEFELAVSVAASVGMRALKDTRDVSMMMAMAPRQNSGSRFSALREAATARLRTLRTSEKNATTRVRSLTTVSAPRMLDDLCGVSTDSNAPQVIELARACSVYAEDVSVAFLVTSASVDTRTIHSASVSFPEGVEVVVLSCAPEVAPGLKRMGRLSVLSIGRLDDVKQLLARGTVSA